MAKYFDLIDTGAEANLSIYGDITSWPFKEGDTSAANLSQALASLPADVKKINVFINSYGGEVAEGLAIYNALKRHSAKVKTVVDGFACSIASVIFMAGDERVMNDSSLLMIHNAWSFAEGNAEELRKQADDLDTINDAIVKAYVNATSIDEKKIRSLMDDESWISPSDALNYGLATEVVAEEKAEHASMSAKKTIFNLIMNATAEEEKEEEPEEEEVTEEETPEDPDEEETPAEEEPEEEDDPEEDPKDVKEASYLDAFLKAINQNRK